MEEASSSELDVPRLMTISDKEFKHFSTWFYEKIGLNLSPQKKAMLVSRLAKRVYELQLSSFDSYYRVLNESGDIKEQQKAIDLMTTNETYFFREIQQLDYFRDHVLKKRVLGQSLSVWSAASSTGEEAYSLAMILADQMGIAGWRILATDISERTLRVAQKGLYGTERIQFIPPSYLKRFCMRGTGKYQNTLLVDRLLRDRVELGLLNLMEIPHDMEKFDVIFLRNVIIYFDLETKKKVIRDIINCLAPNGYLFMGLSDSLVIEDLPIVSVAPSIYRKV